MYKKAAWQVDLPNCFRRNEATRTPDPYVPNVVRYQLRYIPMSYRFDGAKVGKTFDTYKFLFTFFSS